jgi:hypothetical protein
MPQTTPTNNRVGFLQQGSRVDRVDARAIFGAVVAAAEQAALAGVDFFPLRQHRRHARRVFAANDQRVHVGGHWSQRVEVGIAAAHTLVAGAVGRAGVRGVGVRNLNQHADHFGGAFVRVAAAVELGGRRRRAAAQQLKHQLVERDLAFVVGAGVANQLAVQIHGVITRFTVVADFFAIGGVGGGHSGGSCLICDTLWGNYIPYRVSCQEGIWLS